MSSYKKMVLFIDKVLLSPKNTPIRGVEVFNLNLIRELNALSIELTVPAHSTWIQTIMEHIGNRQVETFECSVFGSSLLNGLSAVRKLRRRKFEVLLLANVANGLIPSVQILHRLGVVDRCVLIAHREPSRRFVNAQSRMPTTVLAVNTKIASHFRSPPFEFVGVSYGVINAEAYFPGQPASITDERVRFCVLGQLDNVWKGADTVVSAFRKLPDYVHEKCELHLASFTDPPQFPESNIVVYKWIDVSEIPEFLRKMDVMVVPSRDEGVMRETFSQAMVQGMLTGLPIIVNNLPVLIEKLDGGGGLVYKSIDELTEVMTELIRLPEQRRTMGSQGRKTALERYVWNTKRFLEYYLFPAVGDIRCNHEKCG